MPDTSLASILIDGVTLAVSVSLLLVLLWHDNSKRIIQGLALFVGLVAAWNIGNLIGYAAFFADSPSLTSLSSTLVETGRAASNVAIYTLMTLMIGIRTLGILRLAYAGVALTVFVRLILQYFAGNAIAQSAQQIERLSAVPSLFFFLFSVLALNLLVLFRRRLTNPLLRVGVLLFAVGQGMTFLNPEVGIVSLASNVASIGVLFVSMAIVSEEVIRPLKERAIQVKTLHQVSTEIAGEPRLLAVLHEIARQAAGWIGGDAAVILLRRGDLLEVVAEHNMPAQFHGLLIPMAATLSGLSVQSGTSQRVEHYARDWQGTPDLPMADSVFGSVIAAPLIHRDTIAGVLMSVAGTQGRLFTGEDTFRLELLTPLAALAVASSGMIEAQRALTQEVDDSRRQLESLLISTESPVVAVDRQMCLIFANPAARHTFGLYDTQAGAPLLPLLPASALPTNPRAVIHDLRRSKVHIYEVTVNDQIFACHLARLGESRARGWVAVLHDVTRLKELDRMKGEMIRMVSHDLKNPLMAAMLQIDLIRDGLGGDPASRMDILEHQLERMNRIIRGVLDVERLRGGVLNMRAFPIAPVLEKVVDDLARLAEDAQIELSLASDSSGDLIGDADQVERAIANLVENAIKFTPVGGRVTVTASQRGSTVGITVNDTGIGIPAEIHSRIFERFFRGGQPGFEHITGTGLGLSLVKAVVENHHGQISLESTPGSGSTFLVTLPAVRTSTES